MGVSGGRIGAVLAAVALAGAVSACGSDDGGALERSADETTTTAVPEPSAPEDPTTTDDTSGDAEDADDAASASEPTSTEPDPGGREPPAPPPDLTSAQVCELVPAATVAEALGVAAVTPAAAGSSGTPQCAYGFERADGTESNVTVAALRVDGDLAGRVGDDAFRYTVDLNRRAGGAGVEERPVAIGDEALVFTGEALRLVVIRYGGRIVTVIVGADAAGADAAVALGAATAPLAP